MALKVLFLLATLTLVSVPACSATGQQQQQQQAEQQCVSRADLDGVVAQIAVIESAHSSWRNATLHILKTYLPANPTLLLESIPDKLENIQSKMIEEFATSRNTTMDDYAKLQDKVDKLQERVITLEEKLQNSTEASTRKLHHEVVELLQNTSCSSEGVYTDCKDALTKGQTTSGVYTIKPDHQPEFQAYCDMDTDGGGWTVFQRREDGSVNFYRYWTDYQQGFGHPSGEFWLGLDKIHRLTPTAIQLRIDIQDFEGNSRYAQYQRFSVGDSASRYTLSASGYSGTAGNSFFGGDKFSTRDQDNDAWGRNCAQTNKGGWWYHACWSSHLNGVYHHGSFSGPGGVTWYAWRGYYYSFKFTEMKLREN